MYKICGTDLDNYDIIPAGSELICDYEISDGGNIFMSASVPCIARDFGKKNFYYYDEDKLNLDAQKLSDSGQEFINRIDDISGKIDDERLDKARAKAEKAESIDSEQINDSESIQEASNELYEAKKIFAEIYKDRAGEINQIDLDNCIRDFKNIAKYADSSETASFNNLVRTAKRSINEPIFARYLDELRRIISIILWRQDWFVVDYFNNMIPNVHNADLIKRGQECIKQGKIDGLRGIIWEIINISGSKSTGSNDVNIIRI